MDGNKKTPAINIPSPTRSKERDESKIKSTFELSNSHHQRVDELHLEEPMLRRRSKSAPLTLEATGVAKELRKASDSMQSQYEGRRKAKLARRRTVASTNSKRQSWPAWDPSSITEEEAIPVFPYSQSYPATGTSV